MPISHHEDLLRSALQSQDFPELDMQKEWKEIAQRLNQPQIAQPRGIQVPRFAAMNRRQFILSVACLMFSLGMVGCVIHAVTATQYPHIETVVFYTKHGQNVTPQYIAAITQRYPLHPLSQTQPIDGVTATLSGVYADASHTFLAVDFSAPARFDQFAITAQKGVAIMAGASLQLCTPTIPNQAHGPVHCLIVLPPFRAASSATTSFTMTLTIHTLWINEESGGSSVINIPPQEVRGTWTFQIATPYFPDQHSVINVQLQATLDRNG
jgi:hypothetical protein